MLAAAFTRRAFKQIEPEFKSIGEQIIFESAIGLGLLALLVFTLGALQLFYFPAFIALILAVALIGLRELSGVICNCISVIRSIKIRNLEIANLTAGIVISSIAVIAILRALVPPVGDDWDSLAYHLAIPKLYLKHHGIYYVQFASHSNFPFLWEMLYTLGLAFKSTALAKLFHFMAWLMLLGASWHLADRHFGRKTSLTTIIILAAVPIAIWEATTAYVDAAAALFVLLSIYAAMNFRSTSDRRWIYAAGILAGFAASVKMTALAAVPISAVWVLWPIADTKQRRLSLVSAIVCILIAIVTAAPWYIKSLIYTGNPFYPFFYEVFGGRNWTAEAAALYRADQLKFGLGHDLLALLMLPWNLTFRFARFVDFGARIGTDIFELPGFTGNALAYISSVGPIFLAALPAITFGIIRKGVHRPLILTAGALGIVWFFSMQNARYLIPAIALLTPAVAETCRIAGLHKAIKWTAIAAAAFNLIILVIFTIPSISTSIGLEKPKDYLMRCSNIYRASYFLNEETPTDTKIALFGETRGFYIEHEYLWADPGNNPLVPSDIEKNPSRLAAWLSSNGISYILINRLNLPNDIAQMLLTTQDFELVYPPDNTDDQGIAVFKINQRLPSASKSKNSP